MSAWQGGIGAGLVATGLSALLSSYFFLPPFYSLSLNLSGSTRIVIFVLECILISLVCGSLRSKNQQLDRNLLQLSHSEELLRAANQRITGILESITDGFYTLDSQWQFAYVNNQAEQFMQRSRQELLGQSIWQVFPDLRGGIAEQSFYAAVAGRKSLVFEMASVVVPERWFEMHVNPFVDGLAVHFQDITHRRQNEIIARARAEELEIFMKTVPAAVWIAHDPLCHHMTANQTAYELVRLPSGTTATATPADGAYPFGFRIQRDGQDIPLDQLPMQQAGHTGQNVEAELDFVFETGEVRSLYGRAVPLRNEHGQVRGVIGAFLDVTERKQAIESLRLSENRYRTLANAVSQLMWINDTEGRALFFNQRWHDYTEAPLEVGENWWQDIIHPEDLQPALVTRTRAIQKRQPYEVECRLKRFDQTYRWHLARVVPLKDEQGEVLQWFGTATDIHDFKQTEAALRESELNFRTMADTMPQLFWTTQANGYHEYFNKRWYEYTGMSPDQTEGWGWSKMLHPDDCQRCLDTWNESLRTGKDYNIEYRFRQASNGQYRWFLGRAFPLRDEAGKILKWFGSCTDIHDQKLAMEERDRALERERAAREDAESANRIKDEFLAVLSHELRSPLNPILGWTKLLRTRQFSPEMVDRALETIERNAKLQTQLIEDLLDVSRILRGKLILNVNAVDLKSTIEAAIETVQLAAEAKAIQIQTKLDLKERLVSGDAGRLQQIVWNLLSNAVKFTPEAGQVTVCLSQIGNYAQIQVQDTGKGIDIEFLPYVFEYFRQADSTITRKFGGLGLGLAIVRHLTELHGGTVQVASQGEGMGAVFTVSLPLIASSPSPLNNLELVGDNLDLIGLTILVVDDDADLRDLLVITLQHYGATVKVAASAAEALAILEQFPLDGLISDIGMPDVDGYTLMRQVRQRSPEQGGQIPAIALTAYAGEYDQRQALAAGFQRHISKPVEPEALVKAIALLVKAA